MSITLFLPQIAHFFSPPADFFARYFSSANLCPRTKDILPFVLPEPGFGGHILSQPFDISSHFSPPNFTKMQELSQNPIPSPFVPWIRDSPHLVSVLRTLVVVSPRLDSIFCRIIPNETSLLGKKLLFFHKSYAIILIADVYLPQSRPGGVRTVKFTIEGDHKK